MIERIFDHKNVTDEIERTMYAMETIDRASKSAEWAALDGEEYLAADNLKSAVRTYFHALQQTALAISNQKRYASFMAGEDKA